jgi:hypothetical protein
MVLRPAKVEINPGGRTAIQVDLFNAASLVDHLKLSVAGLPPTWVTLREPVTELMPGSTSTLTFEIHPPQDVSAKAGSHPYTLIVTSEAKPGESMSMSGEVVVLPFERFSAEFHPSQIPDGGKTRVTILNQGNAEGTYSLTGRDPAGAVQFAGEHGRIRVASGQAVTQEVTVRARSRPLLGAPQTLSFELLVKSASNAQQPLSGQLQVIPFIPRWVPMSLVGLLTLCLVGMAFLYFGIVVPGKEAAQATQAASETSAFLMGMNQMTGTQVAQETTIALSFTPTPTVTATPVDTATATPPFTPTPTDLPSATPMPTQTATGIPSPTPTDPVTGFSGTWISVRDTPAAFLVSEPISRLEISKVDRDTVTFSACKCRTDSCERQVQLDPPKVIANINGDDLVAETAFNVAQNHTWTIKAIKSGGNLLVTVEETKDGITQREPFEMKIKPFSPRDVTVFGSCDPPIFTLPILNFPGLLLLPTPTVTPFP